MSLAYDLCYIFNKEESLIALHYFQWRDEYVVDLLLLLKISCVVRGRGCVLGLS